MNEKNKKLLFGIIGLVVAVVALALVYIAFRPKTDNPGGSKNITVTVVYEDKSTKDFKIKTNEDWLRGALEQEKLIEGSESEWGMYVTVVDGVAVDDEKHQWWAFYLGDEMLSTGVDTTPVNDGDHFKIVLDVY